MTEWLLFTCIISKTGIFYFTRLSSEFRAEGVIGGVLTTRFYAPYLRVVIFLPRSKLTFPLAPEPERSHIFCHCLPFEDPAGQRGPVPSSGPEEKVSMLVGSGLPSLIVVVRVRRSLYNIFCFLLDLTIAAPLLKTK